MNGPFCSKNKTLSTAKLINSIKIIIQAKLRVAHLPFPNEQVRYWKYTFYTFSLRICDMIYSVRWFEKCNKYAFL